MANKELNARIRSKRDSSVNWTSQNPVLLNGEIIIVDTDSGETRFKIGDGTKTYTQLPFEDEVVRNLITAKADSLHEHTADKILMQDSDGNLIVSNTYSMDIGGTLEDAFDWIDNIFASIDESLAEVDGKANKIHTHTVTDISDLTVNATELNYVDGVTSNIQSQLDGKAASSHTHNTYATIEYVDNLIGTILNGAS